MLGRGGTPVFARLHQLLHSGNQAPLLVEDLPDGDDGHAHNGGEGDAPTQHVRPVGEDVVIVGAAFVVDPAEDQDQLKEEMLCKRKVSLNKFSTTHHYYGWRNEHPGCLPKDARVWIETKHEAQVVKEAVDSIDPGHD